jgi:hypothetical protein
MGSALAEVLAAITTESDVVWWRVMLTDHPTRLTLKGVEWSIVPGAWSGDDRE